MHPIPKRIACLSAEVADWFWRIGAWDCVVGVSAFFSSPPSAAPKPRISGFSTGRLDEIERLNPDLVITFSDVQSSLASELMRRGFPVLATNQRTLAETETTLSMLARIVGREGEAERWLRDFRERLEPVETTERRPRVYFEEWNEPLVAGIAWVSELIERAGGNDLFAHLRSKRSAAERIVVPHQVREANPEIIFASWCGVPVEREAIKSRPGWNEVAAVQDGLVYEIPGTDILQPGFRLVHGYEQIKRYLGVATPAAL
jgi:iron complex transport system substrate-binding protein